YVYSFFFFFFSSRRRHTRSYGDWSSDVCSSDLPLLQRIGSRSAASTRRRSTTTPTFSRRGCSRFFPTRAREILVGRFSAWTTRRSEERRVGKECRTRWGREQ